MKVITVLTNSGLKTGIISGDEPTPEEIAEIQARFNNAGADNVPTPDLPDAVPVGSQGPVGEQGPAGPPGEQSPTPAQPVSVQPPGSPFVLPGEIPRSWLAPEPIPEGAPPQISIDRLTPEEREFRLQKGIALDRVEQAYKEGTGVQSRVHPALKARFLDQGPTAGEVSGGKGYGRILGGMMALGAEVAGNTERAKQIDENLARIPYEEGVSGVAEHLTQFLGLFIPGVRAAGALKMGPVATSAITSGAVGATTYSGQQGRLADLVKDVPVIGTPINEYLGTDPDDSFAEGRLKNALEFATVDAAITAPLVKIIKMIKGGAAAKPNGQLELVEKVASAAPKADPKKVIMLQPTESGVHQVAHVGPIHIPDNTIIALNKPAQKTIELAGKAMEFTGLNKALMPISGSIQKISPRISNGLHKFEIEQLLASQSNMERAAPFLNAVRKIKKANKGDAEKLTEHILNSEFLQANQILRRYKNNGVAPEGIREFMNTRQLLDDLHKYANDNGLKIKYLKNHFPRIMKDYEGFMNASGWDIKDPIDVAIDTAMRAKNNVAPGQPLLPGHSQLTPFEEREAIREYFENSMYSNSNQFGSAMERVIDKIEPEHLKFYGSLEENISNYINNVTYRVAKNRYTGEVAGVTSYHDEIARLRQAGKITTEQGNELERLIAVRLNGGEQSIGAGAKVYRDLMYLTSIGNPISTITQASEWMLNAYANGTLTTLQTTGQTLKGTGVRIKDLGLTDIAKEFSDPLSRSQVGVVGTIQKDANELLRKTLGVTGFKRMDELMKESHLNGAFLEAQKNLANTNSPQYREFVRTQSKYFENETQSLIDAIKRGDVNDPNVKVYLFSRLSRTQPISLSEYPEVYLKYPFMRPAYFLKSFGLKQLETTRREVLRKIGSGNAKEIREGWKQAMRLSVIFAGVGMGGNNLFKDYILDRDDKPGMALTLPSKEKAWHAVADGLLTLIGLSRYSGRKLVDPDKRQEGLVDLFTPPRTTDILKGEWFGIGGTRDRDIPIVGKIFSEHFGSAAEYKKKKRIEKFKRQKREMKQGPDIDLPEIDPGF
jgi:hypothetical protein